MLDEKFLGRLREAFPEFYARIDGEARADAQRLLAQNGNDVGKALVRARFEAARVLWWPYVKGSIPFVGRDREAMEGFSRLVLTVYHVVGYAPSGMDAAREQVVDVLRHSLDVERLRKVLNRDTRATPETAAASAGLVAGVGALWAPVATWRRYRGAIRFVPPPARVLLAALVLGALASIPVVAAYSAGRQAEERAKGTASGNGLPAGDGARLATR